MSVETIVSSTAESRRVSDLRPMSPRQYRVIERRRETEDVVTLRLAPAAGKPMPFRAGQFNMLTAFGIGEAAISVSSPVSQDDWIEHTVRDIGAVTHALCTSGVGDPVGVRGPFGVGWGVEDALSGDVVVVAGGIGIAPLRGAIYQLLEGRRRGNVSVIAGARSPSQIMFLDDLESWTHLGAGVSVTVDTADPGWKGHVGLVTSLLAGVNFDPSNASALVCGPEIMMRFTAMALINRGVDPGRIKISLERNMQCGVGWCGHCQLGPWLVCRDGPVVSYDGVTPHLLRERER